MKVYVYVGLYLVCLVHSLGITKASEEGRQTPSDDVLCPM